MFFPFLAAAAAAGGGGCCCETGVCWHSHLPVILHGLIRTERPDEVQAQRHCVLRLRGSYSRWLSAVQKMLGPCMWNVNENNVQTSCAHWQAVLQSGSKAHVVNPLTQVGGAKWWTSARPVGNAPFKSGQDTLTCSQWRCRPVSRSGRLV